VADPNSPLDELSFVLAHRAVDRTLAGQQWHWTFQVQRKGRGRGSRAVIAFARVALKEPTKP